MTRAVKMEGNKNWIIPKTIDDITVDWFNNFMKPQGVEVISLKVLGDANEGRGALSSLERVELVTLDDKKINVIIKLLPTNKDIRNYVVDAGFVTREVQMYTKVFEDQKRFLVSRSVTKDHWCRTPQCYYGKEEGTGESYSMILVLEDMIASGYELWPEGPGKHLDLSRILATIKEIAIFHSTSIAYGLANGIQNFFDVYPFLYDYTKRDDSLQVYIDAGFKVVTDLLRETPGVPDGCITQLEYLAKVFTDLLYERFVETKYSFACIRHHDMHTGNWFYKAESDGSCKAGIIDFQNCQNDGNFIIDVCYFLLCCCDLKYSTTDLETTISAYHKVFTESLKAMKVEFPYTLHQMLQDYKKSVIVCLLHIITGAPTWCHGPQSNQVSRDRLTNAVIWAFNEKLLDYTPKKSQ